MLVNSASSIGDTTSTSFVGISCDLHISIEIVNVLLVLEYQILSGSLIS